MSGQIHDENGRYITGYFANHYLRATAVSRLFQEGVDEKLIRSVTRRRSEALDSYERDTLINDLLKFQKESKMSTRMQVIIWVLNDVSNNLLQIVVDAF